MKLDLGDYVIVQLNDKQKALARVVTCGDKKVQIRLEKDNDDAPPIDIKPKEVVANLGAVPKNGTMYGIKVEPLIKVIDAGKSQFWGEIRIYRQFDDGEMKTLKKNMDGFVDKIKERNLPKLKIETEIRNLNGAMLGCYKHRPKGECDILEIRPTPDTDFNYIAGHEYAHGLWFRNLTPKARINWVKAYHENIVLRKSTEEELNSILEGVHTEGDIGAYARSCDEETLTVLKACIRHIKQVHGIDRKHLDTMLMLGDSIEEYWPEAVELGDKQTVISKYATKSPEELFAEAFAFKFIGRKLPSKLDTFMQKTLATLIK